MELFGQIVTVASLIIAILVALIALVFAAAWLTERLEWRREKAYRRQYDRALIEIGQRLHGGAHWFSESTEAYVAIRTLGERLMRGHGTDASDWREEWRRALADEGKPS